MSTASPSQWAEWRRNWPLALSAFMGIGLVSSLYGSIGMFIGPLTEEFGWTRTQISAGTTLSSLVMIPLSPLVGGLIDRWGPRKIALPGLLLTMCAISALSLANGSTTQWLILWGVVGLFGSLLNTTVWTYSVVGAFNAGRSMALAVVLAGSTFGNSIAPPLAQVLTDNLGWRAGFMGFGFGLGGLAFVLCLLFFKVPFFVPPSAGKGDGEGGANLLPGLTMKEAARSVPLYRIAGATLIIMTLGAALLVHKAPILIEAGISRADAAGLAALSGLAGMSGKFVTGWAMQKWDAGLVGGISLGAMGFAMIFLLPHFATPTTIVLSMMVVGFAGGSKLQIAAYLTSIYAGARNYGKIFGSVASLMAVGGGLGPLLGGIAFDVAGSYSLLIYAGIPSCFVGWLLLVRLGEYPDWTVSPPESAPREQPLEPSRA